MKRDLKALVIDDDDLARHSIASVFTAEGWNVHETKFEAESLEIISAGRWNVVIFELSPERSKELGLLQSLLHSSSNTKVVLTSSNASAVEALDATVLGAFEYLPKPLDVNDLRLLSIRLAERFKSFAGFMRTDESMESSESDQTLVGKSDSLIEVMKQIGRVAGTSLPVLLTGESGTGKEVIAGMLHKRSGRRDGPFVAVNCSAIPAALIESELFGHEKGAFTGADRERPGLWEEAAGGTILLDEITETGWSFQAKLLRTLQCGEVRRVGSNQMRRLDVRVIAASNRNVQQEVEAGRFRADLFHRLNAVSVRLPSLRERREDIPLLIEAFARRISPETKLRLSSDVLDIFQHYSWPGNVRELEHVVMRCVAMCDGVVLPQDLPESIKNQCNSPVELSTLEVVRSQIQDWPQLAALEGAYVAEALAHNAWNKQATARMLNVDRKTLDRMIKRHEIVRPLKAARTDENRRAA